MFGRFPLVVLVENVGDFAFHSGCSAEQGFKKPSLVRVRGSDFAVISV